MMKLGFNTRGTEDYFENVLRTAIQERTTKGFQYLEIGVAEGRTLVSVADVIRENVPEWRAVGIDLENGPFFNVRNFLAMAIGHEAEIIFQGSGRQEPFVSAAPLNGFIRVLLLKNGEKRALVSPDSINFCLIDGCHGAPCVEKDFLSIEPGIVKGGIVAFHDAGNADQGIHFQQHCQMPISVQQALWNLRLLIIDPPSTGTIMGRSGWEYLGDIAGDKSPNDLQQNGHGFVFFKKI